MKGKNHFDRVASFETVSVPLCIVHSRCSKILYTKVFDKIAYANNLNPDQTAFKEQSDLGLHCLPFHYVF